MTRIRPRRDEHSHYSNETPIANLYEALYLLQMTPSSDEPHHLARYDDWALGAWEIIVPWYCHGDSGGDTCGSHHFQIEQLLAQGMVDQRLVGPRTINRWGGVETEANKLVIQPLGIKQLGEFENRQLLKAQKLLIPGVHTDLSGEAREYHRGREHWRYGKYYVDFKMPDGRICRAFPETDMLVVPEHSTEVVI